MKSRPSVCSWLLPWICASLFLNLACHVAHGDELHTDYGFNFTYGGDLMLGAPWIASGVIDLGTVGDATMFHCRATLGYQLHGVELYTGFDYFSIDSVHINGLVGGLRFWL